MDKRRYPRMNDLPCLVDVSDGNGFFSGYVEDLSRFGLRLSDLPERIDEKARRLSVVISGKNVHFKLSAKVRWSKDSGKTKSIGLELINAPWKWTEFVIEKEPSSEDPWAYVEM